MAAVLAAYMGGLGTGAAVAGRLLGRIRRPILVYGLLEGGVALSALCVPALLDGASWLHVKALGGLLELSESGGLARPLYYLFVSFLILALPTGFMGATLPLLTRYAVRQDAQVGPRIAWLYGINTAGAVLGALTAAFLVLPALGLRATVWVGVGVGTWAKGQGTAEPIPLAFDEVLFIVEGSLSISIDGQATEVRQGQIAHLPAKQQVMFRSEEGCRLVWVISPPTWKALEAAWEKEAMR